MEKKMKWIKHPAIAISGLLVWVLVIKVLLLETDPEWRLWAAGIYSAVMTAIYVDFNRC
jgi:hypothetical protein